MEAPGEGITGLAAKEESTKILKVAEGKVVFNSALSLPICPMIGVIGTAPEKEAVATGTPEAHGGNMDCKKIGEGAVLYLPVNGGPARSWPWATCTPSWAMARCVCAGPRSRARSR